MRVYVTHDPVELDQLPTGNAGSIAEELRGGAEVGRTFTLKVDGVVLYPTDSVPAGASVIEVVEHVPDHLPPAAALADPPPVDPPTDED
jgi:hypothetical protein